MNDPILDLPMRQPNDAKAETIREYIAKLALELWENGEGFSGKRPFGSSGWIYDIGDALEDAGLISEDAAPRGFRSMVSEAIKRMGKPCDHEALVEDSRKLAALECAGIDNWEGYDRAMEKLCDSQD